MSALAFVVGALAGYCGAIPPGPVGVAVASHAADGRARRAVSLGAGAALVDATICSAIALGAGPWLAHVVESPMVRLFLALAYAALGIMLVAEAVVRPRTPARAVQARPAGGAPDASDGFARGVLRGVTNPSLVASWTLLITALTASGALPAGRVAGLLFALGVGLGVSAWFATLTHAVTRARGDRMAPWLRLAGVVTGAMLVFGGSLGAARALLFG